jgi:hypothetical protein
MKSTLERLKTQIWQLTAPELDEFRRWFAEFDPAVWDRQFDAEVEARRPESPTDGPLYDW